LPTVIVENGGGGFSVEWALVQPLVAKHTRICTYDRAGYAWSERGPVDDGIEQNTGDLHLLARKAGLRPPFVLVGHSLGALYARAYQRRYPEQVAGLVFVDGTSYEGVTMPVGGERKAISHLSRDQLAAAHAEYLRSVPSLKAGDPAAPPLDRLPAHLRHTRYWAFQNVIRDMGWLPNTFAAAESWRQEFTALRVQRNSNRRRGHLPLRVLERSKDSDKTWHSQQIQLAALSSRGTLTTVGESGHMIHIERPDVVAEAILSVVAESRKSK
jgi:pimeloyl-ACP methyl ester carboxylesterase